MRLTSHEKIRLIIEGIITAGIVIMVFVALFAIMRVTVINITPEILDWPFIQELIEPANQERAFYIGIFTLLLLIVFIVLVVIWRLKRRRRQYELNHIISGLHHIAKGNYSYRIDGNGYSPELKPVIDSIHLLVDNTVEAMEEERRIEQSKDELITNVSHDIRTPLTSIIGYLGLIDTRKFDSPEQALKYNHIAYQKAKQMKNLVEDLFEYTQVSQDQTDLSLTTFDVVSLVEQLAAEYELDAQQSGMEIIIEARSDHIFMKADPEKLVRVFNNIIANAFKYGADGNKIVIRIEKNAPHVYIQVKNNGMPISKRSISHLFERFYRAEESRTQEKKGSGLGLAIAKSIIQLHNGSIDVAVKDGWTQFNIILPLRGGEIDEK